MSLTKLPYGEPQPALPIPHFPTRFQAFIWRNWGLLPIEKLARVLRTSVQSVLSSALELGLPEWKKNPQVPWLERGFITIIRANWHLLPYEQLLELLGWNEQKLATCLKEDDFLWHKLGNKKPVCDPIIWHPLSPQEQEETTHIRTSITCHFPDIQQAPPAAPFDFLGTHPHCPLSNVDSDFDLRLAYSFSALYGDPLLDAPESLYPEEELAAMKSWGINAIWFQVILYQLHPWKYAPEISHGWETRMQNLAELAKRARKHGISIYLYLNEPRCLSTALFEKFPDFRGVEYPRDKYTNLCTTRLEVQEYLKEASAQIFQKIPELGGCFLITMSENPTHCHSHKRGEECPRCATRKPEEVMTEVVRCLEEGIHAGNPAARILVYAWAWHYYDWGLQAVELLPPGVELLCVSEIDQDIQIGGIPEKVWEYSISQPGPGEWAKAMWRQAKKQNLPTHAKIQINTTWECGAVPYIPAVDLVHEHLTKLKKEGVDGIMLGWTLGGYLGGNLGLLGTTPPRLAETLAGKKHAATLLEAWQHFSSAFRQFPFTVAALYRSPVQTGAANLLYKTPTEWTSAMVCFAYDDLDRWRGAYPEEIFENQFRNMTQKWYEGVKCLESIGTPVAEQLSVARALYCHFQSVTSQVSFIRNRDTKNTELLQTLLDTEIDTAKSLYHLVQNDSRIGYEPSNHYFYTANDLMEKVLCCEWLKKIK